MLAPLYINEDLPGPKGKNFMVLKSKQNLKVVHKAYPCKVQDKTIFVRKQQVGWQKYHQRNVNQGDFSGGAVVKNLPANAGDMGSSPGPGRFHMPRSN